jgi:DNA-binding MarR family transcriptional regulator
VNAGLDGTAESVRAAEELIQLSRLVQGIFASTSLRHDLTHVQAKLLCVLAFRPRGMAELARLFGVEKAALTGLIDRAERRGTVSRLPVPGDRRALRVSLTDAGRRAATAFHGDVTEQLDEVLSPLTATEREQFRTAVTKLVAGLSQTGTS